MIETHAHLFDKNLEQNVNTIIKTSFESGIEKIIVPAINLKTSVTAIRMCEEFLHLNCAIGIHPTEKLEEIDEIYVYKLEELLDKSKYIVAIGEIGLDYYHFDSAARLQKEFFVNQLKLAIKNDLAVIIHNRQATVDIIKLIDKNWTPSMSGKLIFHCCEADIKLLEFAIKRNIYIGVDGDVTYDNKKLEFIKKVPLELLLLETDSPYLSPVSNGTKLPFPNSPVNLKIILNFLSDNLNINVLELDKITTANAKKVFNLK